MERTEEKLQIFKEAVMQKAAQRKKEILDKANERKRKTLEEKEIEFLKKAYLKIQKAVKKAQSEQNREISRAVIEGKSRLFSKRTQIMKKVFDSLEKRLLEFREQENYVDFIKDKILKALDEVGEGQMHVIVVKKDEEIAKKICKEIDKSLEVVVSDKSFIGGCIVKNLDTKLLADYSIKTMLKREKEEFLELSKLCILEFSEVG